MSDEDMKIESREVSGEENLRRTLESSLKSGLLQHYGTFAGLTAMKLVLRYIVEDDDEIARVAKVVSDTWKREAERTQYPAFTQQKVQIEMQFPDMFSNEELESLFRATLEETAEYIFLSLLEDDPELGEALSSDCN